jgi:hypothetical protein
MKKEGNGMPEAGGSAAINGFLYQILANLRRISKIRLETKLDGQEIHSPCLILEPKGGGGDNRYEGKGIRIIEQYKTRGPNRTWSLTDLIEEVLPDLFIAVDPDRFSEVTTYRFVTDGRCGRIHHFQRFLENFTSKTALENPVESLDDTQEYPFFNQDSLTDRALFLRVADRLRPQGGRVQDAEHYHKVRHLLTGFAISAERSADDFQQGIDEFLIQVVDRREEVEAKRRELCTILMELASQGNVICTPEEILKSASLNATPFSKLGIFKAKLMEMAEWAFGEKGYARGKDVRGVPTWPSECSILAFTGESGQGKTWQLLRLADTVLARGGSAVIVPASGEADEDLQKASAIVWLDALDHDGPLAINRLAARYQEIHRLADEGWLTICIDDVQEITEARRLISQPWKRWGIRLALAVPLVVGEALAADQLEGVHVLKVRDFTPTETRDCLERRGYDWGEIPDDVRATLRRPILAELYCRIAGTDGWAPHNECEIYESFWQRVTNERDQPHHLSDRGILLRLAGAVIKAPAQYPWPQHVWQGVGLSDEALHRLESIGWLRRGRRGDVEIWHDRLLNWAVAEWLIDQRRAHQIERSELAAILCRMYQNQPTFAGKRLGYMPLDYLWLASDPENSDPNNVVRQDVPILLQALSEGPDEEHPSYAGNPEDFYRDLVPTLGERIYPALRERLKASVSHTDEQFIMPRLIGQAVAKIGEKAPESARRLALDGIKNPEFVFRAAGMYILKELPTSQALDRLWEIHLQHFRALSDHSDRMAHLRHDLSFSALRTCMQLAPQWLVEKIHRSDPRADPVSELGWLLWSLEGPEAKDLWRQLKSTLFEKVSPDAPSTTTRLRNVVECCPSAMHGRRAA